MERKSKTIKITVILMNRKINTILLNGKHNDAQKKPFHRASIR